MDWVALSTHYDSDPRIVAAERQAEGAETLFTRCIAYAGRNNTGGFIPAEEMPRIMHRKLKPRLGALVDVEALVVVDGGYRLPAWGRWQSQHDQEADRRSRDRDRKARKRAEEREAVSAGLSADSPRNVSAHRTQPSNTSVCTDLSPPGYPQPPRDIWGESTRHRPAPRPVPHDCDAGWAGTDGNGRPIPCATCKPHLRVVG